MTEITMHFWDANRGDPGWRDRPRSLVHSVNFDIEEHASPWMTLRDSTDPLEFLNEQARADVRSGLFTLHLRDDAEVPSAEKIWVVVTQNGVLRFPGLYDDRKWTPQRDIEEAVRNGYLHGDPRSYVVEIHGPFGGDGPASIDFVNWLLDVGVDIGLPIIRDALVLGLASLLGRRFRNSLRDRRARVLAQYWATNMNLVAPHQLRNWLETKDAWSIGEVSDRLKLGMDSSRALLKALGYVPHAGGSWRLGAARRAIARRSAWIVKEGKHPQNIRPDLPLGW